MERPHFEARALLPALVIAPFLVIMLLGAMLPAVDFDVLEYHLQGPKEYYQAGRIAFLPHNVYTNMPFGVEMLHLMGMEVLGDWWWGGLVGQLLVALFAPAAAVLIAAAAGRAGTPRGLARGDHLPDDTVDLSPGRDRVRGGAALLSITPRSSGRDSRAGTRETWHGAVVDAARPADRRSDGLQVPGPDLGRDPVRRAGPG